MLKIKPALAFVLPLLSVTSAWADSPPATWTEHWFEHNQVLTKVFQDNDVAVYYDSDVSRSITWPNTYMSQVWRYTKKTYGNFGVQPQLYAVYHTNKYSGGHPSGYFDASHDYRNVIDVGPGPWTSGTGNDLDLVTHEVGHIVEGDSKGVHGSPAFGLWGDSKWNEIFIYDVYVGLGRSADVTRWYNLMIGGTDSFPRANTHWFRDWFYPIYSKYGGSAVLNRYFVLVAQYFPKNGSDNARDMNWGEFVHFWSGAAGVNLKSMATTAFGWPTDYENQFNQAQKDFPFTYATPKPTAVSLFQDINYGGYGVSLPVGSYNVAALKNQGMLNKDLSSLQVTSGYKVTLYSGDNFTGSSLVKTASDTTLVDDSWNDLVQSIVVSASTTTPSSTTLQAESYSTMSGIITEATSDTGGGSDVGGIETADWMAYNNVNFPTSGPYLFEYRVSSLSGGGRLSVDLNAGATTLGMLDLPSTGGWQTWTTASQTVNVTAGTYNLGVYAQAGGWNLNWLRITKSN